MCLAAALALTPAASWAQVSIDMNRISCGQLVAMSPDDASLTAAWLSGWFNQKNNYTWIDLRAYHRNVASVTQYCAANPNEMVMAVVQRAALANQQKH